MAVSSECFWMWQDSEWYLKSAVHDVKGDKARTVPCVAPVLFQKHSFPTWLWSFCQVVCNLCELVKDHMSARFLQMSSGTVKHVEDGGLVCCWPEVTVGVESAVPRFSWCAMCGPLLCRRSVQLDTSFLVQDVFHNVNTCFICTQINDTGVRGEGEGGRGGCGGETWNLIRTKYLKHSCTNWMDVNCSDRVMHASTAHITSRITNDH